MKISPVVGLDSSWDEIIKFIDRGGIGCAIVISEDGFYQGIITNHDMRVAVNRTGLTKELTAIDIYNAKSFTSDPEEDFWTFMLRMQQKGAMHTVVPLVSKDLVFHGVVRTQDALFKNAYVGGN
jgi:signal-transduction protein with cAMP-binding, CBS, and nucleotidyltransferase domain